MALPSDLLSLDFLNTIRNLWECNLGGTSTLYTRLTAVHDKFDLSTGHDHDGTDSKSILAAALPSHAHTSSTTGGDFAWADITAFAAVGDIADTAGTESAGTATTVARGDHVHAIHSHAHTSATTGGDYPWADITAFAEVGDIADTAGTESAGTATTVARGDHVHAIHSHAHTSATTGGDFAWADITDFAEVGDIADTAATESAGTATTVARGDHVHAIHSHAHTSSTTGGDYPWADLTGVEVVGNVTAVAVATAAGAGTTWAAGDHAHKGPTVLNRVVQRTAAISGTGVIASGITVPQAVTLSQVEIQAETMPVVTAADGVGFTIGAATIDVVKFGTGSVFSVAPALLAAIDPTTVRKTVDVGANYTDYTSEATDVSAATDVVLGALDTFANGDWLAIGADIKFAGVMIAMDAADKNDTASIMDVEYWNGAAWASVTPTDGTDVAGDTLKQSGNVTWALPEDWAKNTIDTVEAYHVRIIVSVPLDNPTNINEIAVIRPTNCPVVFTPDQNNTLLTTDEVLIAVDEADAAMANIIINLELTP